MSLTDVLCIGKGARIHALGWTLARSPNCERVLFSPGNAGTTKVDANVDLGMSPDNAPEIARFCDKDGIGLIVIGPEDPLAMGLVDALRREGVKAHIFGPTKAGARIEADRRWTKELLKRRGIPQADYEVFTDAEEAEAFAFARKRPNKPAVAKAGGLAGGKGAIICADNKELRQAIHRIMVKREFGEAGADVVVEDLLVGEEVSVHALVGGRNHKKLADSKDFKLLYPGEDAPNTGGMGAFSPAPSIGAEIRKQMAHIVHRTVSALADELDKEGEEFTGVLYFGFMLTEDGPKVLEVNCRFGDPETQPLMMRLRGDLLKAMMLTCDGKPHEADLTWDPRPALCVVMASKSYPDGSDKGKPIYGLECFGEGNDDQRRSTLFYAGVARQGEQFVIDGGRVLSVCALGNDARKIVHHDCARIRGALRWRTDIGEDEKQFQPNAA